MNKYTPVCASSLCLHCLGFLSFVEQCPARKVLVLRGEEQLASRFGMVGEVKSQDCSACVKYKCQKTVFGNTLAWSVMTEP